MTKYMLIDSHIVKTLADGVFITSSPQIVGFYDTVKQSYDSGSPRAVVLRVEAVERPKFPCKHEFFAWGNGSGDGYVWRCNKCGEVNQ